MEQSLRNKVKALCLVCIATFLLLSFISYNPEDTPFRSFPHNAPEKNLTGIVGAYVAETLLLSIGWTAYIICLLLVVWAGE